MHEDIFTRTALNESVTFRAVEPLYRAFFFHDLLLSHLAKKNQYSKFRLRGKPLRSRYSLEPAQQQIRIPAFFRDKTYVAEKMLESGLECCANHRLHIHSVPSLHRNNHAN
jgi:hypothetical protein